MVQTTKGLDIHPKPMQLTDSWEVLRQISRCSEMDLVLKHYNCVIMKNNSKIIKASNYRWGDVPQKQYKDNPGCYEGVRRYSLLGEGEDEHELNFQTRYFEISPGGYTSFERHRHPHSVVVIRGKGSVVLDNNVYELDLHDVVYISPETMHQFYADKGETLGFLCVVDRYRDKPVLPDDEQVKKVITSKTVQDKIRRQE